LEGGKYINLFIFKEAREKVEEKVQAHLFFSFPKPSELPTEGAF